MEKIIDDEKFLEVRLHAVKVMGKLKDKRAASILFKAKKKDPNDEIRKEACVALKSLRQRID